MLRRGRSRRSGRGQAWAPVFAALGDETRLLLVRKLCGGQPRSIAQLTEGLRVTRQAITKHLRVLEGAGIVHGVRRGRENRFELDPQPIRELRGYLELVAEQWDQALAKLKAFVEE
jgi:DNA-binding transcriptional ArsR family regulator